MSSMHFFVLFRAFVCCVVEGWREDFQPRASGQPIPVRTGGAIVVVAVLVASVWVSCMVVCMFFCLARLYAAQAGLASIAPRSPALTIHLALVCGALRAFPATPCCPNISSLPPSTLRHVRFSRSVHTDALQRSPTSYVPLTYQRWYPQTRCGFSIWGSSWTTRAS